MNIHIMCVCVCVCVFFRRGGECFLRTMSRAIRSSPCVGLAKLMVQLVWSDGWTRSRCAGPLPTNLFVFRKPKRTPRGTASRYYFAGEALANLLFYLAVIPYIPQLVLVGWSFRIGCLRLFLLVIIFFLLHRPVVFFLLHRPVTCMKKESLLLYSLAPCIYHSLISSLLLFFPQLFDDFPGEVRCGHPCIL